MRFLLPLFLSAATVATTGVVAPVAKASVSVAVLFDTLIKATNAVGIVTPVEQHSVWEDGRIFTYYRVHIDNAVAGDISTGGEAWVRTRGGVVGHVGQLVDGEAGLSVGTPTLLFLSAGPVGAFEVAARAQGQYPVQLDEKKRPIVKRNASAGLLLQPRIPAGVLSPQRAMPQSVHAATLASSVLAERPLDEVTRDVAQAWKQLHVSP